jgi:UDP-2,3-diacylglucosamine hydrolase
MTSPKSDHHAGQGRTAILAGSGRLPEILAQSLGGYGANPFVVAVDSDTGNWIASYDHANVPVTQLSKLANTLIAASVQTLVLAGGIKVRPRLRSFPFDWMTIRQLPRLWRALRKGDDALLTEAINWLESLGYKVIGAHEAVPSLLAPLGALTRLSPAGRDNSDIRMSITEAMRLGRADIGQAAVARDGEVIETEDRSGTQAMLQRLALNQHGFSRSGVLAKFAKPQQEVRVDLPAIGPDTVEQVAAAGLAGIVIEAGRSLILDRDEVVTKADELGIFVVGVRG